MIVAKSRFIELGEHSPLKAMRLLVEEPPVKPPGTETEGLLDEE
jgi:hypothetical protein